MAVAYGGTPMADQVSRDLGVSVVYIINGFMLEYSLEVAFFFGPF